MESWYAVVHPGLEPALVEELRELGVKAQEEPGGAAFQADFATGARIAHLARLPSRLLLVRARGPARSVDELQSLVRRADWSAVLHPAARREVSVSSSASRLHFRGSLEGKVEAMLADRLKGPRLTDRGRRPTLTQRIQLKIQDDQAVLSVDAGGDLLHRRGWRTDGGPATIRENLGAALIRLAGWDRQEPLLDPFCGTGTLAIEAALCAAGRSPFSGRKLACAEWPGLSSFNLPKPARVPSMPLIVGSDREPRALAAATANAGRAGVGIRWFQQDIGDVQAPAPTGLIVTNPPYGHRLQEDQAYASLGALLYRLVGWRAVFISPRPELAARVHPAARRLCTFSNGGLRVGVYLAEDRVR